MQNVEKFQFLSCFMRWEKPENDLPQEDTGIASMLSKGRDHVPHRKLAQSDAASFASEKKLPRVSFRRFVKRTETYPIPRSVRAITNCRLRVRN